MNGHTSKAIFKDDPSVAQKMITTIARKLYPLNLGQEVVGQTSLSITRALLDVLEIDQHDSLIKGGQIYVLPPNKEQAI